jgi:hypothetical protein
MSSNLVLLLEGGSAALCPLHLHMNLESAQVLQKKKKKKAAVILRGLL